MKLYVPAKVPRWRQKPALGCAAAAALGLIDWLCQCALCIPTKAMHAQVQRRWRQADDGGPLVNSLGNAAPRNAAISPGVVGLLKTSGPSNVAGAIWSIDVDAVDGVLGGRSRANVFIERVKAVAPFIAQANASAAVVLPLWNGRIKAPAFDVSPRAVLGRFGHSVREGAGRSHLLIQAPTTSRKTTFQIAGKRGVDRSAIAAAFITATAQVRLNSQTREPFAGEVDEPHD